MRDNTPQAHISEDFMPNRTYNRNSRRRNQLSRDADDDHDEGEMALPSIIPNSWGIKGTASAILFLSNNCTVFPTPLHPFRLNFMGQGYQGVNVEAQSVNAVAVDHSIFNTVTKNAPTNVYTQRFLVAAYIR